LRFVASQLRVAPERVAVIGDDPRVEIEMAVAGRAIGIGVTTGTTSREQWAAQDEVRRPHHVIDSLDEFLPLGLV
jgi:ribonucleotide monophosphatase NagD (HAD superfamily)